MIGRRLGPYEVLAKLGEGGMGEVYRARDSKLKREVAIKVLPADVASDRERLARFQREAEVLASLNHPNIAQVYGIEDGALVMELVDGEDLSQRIARGPLPLDEALPIARQIAEALEAAHDAGIVHRDLKPANIKLRDDGTVKVLDFGLAKAMEMGAGSGEPGAANTLANSPTITSPAMTLRGVILGTAAYMAPEQAKGKPVDRRADIWAFGCVLYEMLTGSRAFKGDDVTDVIASVMRDTPDWTALPASTTPAIRTLLRRCLEKEPRKRIPHIAMARLTIDDAGALSDDDRTIITPRRRRWPSLAAVAAGSALAASLTTLLISRPGPETRPPMPVLRYTLELPVTQSILSGGVVTVSVSPNGQYVAVSGRTSGFPYIWVRALDGGEFTPVPGSLMGIAPFWSPDSTEIMFFANRSMLRARVPGGAAQEFADASAVFGYRVMATVSGTWLPDGTILVGGPEGVFRVASPGRELTKAVDPSALDPKPMALMWPMSLSREGLLYTRFTSGIGDGGALVFRAGAKESPLLGTRSRAIHTPDGLLVARSVGPNAATLNAHGFDLGRGMLDMPGTVLAADASLEFGASSNGVIVYRRSRADIPYRFEWVDARGQPTGDAFDTVDISPFNLSQDGSLLAYVENGNVIVRDLARGVGTQLVSNAAEPILSPDARQIAYSLPAATPPAIVVQPSSGGPARTVFTDSAVTLVEDWSSDGKFLAANRNTTGLLIPLDTTQQPTEYARAAEGGVIDESRFSPDGGWMLFNSNETGRAEVYLVPLPPTGERWQLSPAGGSQGRWRRDGRAIYYMSGTGDIMTVDVALARNERPKIGAPRKLFATGLTPTPNIDQFATNPDGSRFLLRRPGDNQSLQLLHVIVNWPALVNRQ